MSELKLNLVAQKFFSGRKPGSNPIGLLALVFLWSYPNRFTRLIITFNSVKYRYMLINHNLFYDTWHNYYLLM